MKASIRIDDVIQGNSREVLAKDIRQGQRFSKVLSYWMGKYPNVAHHEKIGNIRIVDKSSCDNLTHLVIEIIFPYGCGCEERDMVAWVLVAAMVLGLDLASAYRSGDRAVELAWRRDSGE